MYAAAFTTVVLALAVSAMSLTITRANISLPLRTWAEAKSAWLGKLLSCPYCTSHWLAFAVVAVYQPRLITSRVLVIDLFLTALAIVAIASVCSGWIFNAIASVHMPEDE